MNDNNNQRKLCDLIYMMSKEQLKSDEDVSRIIRDLSEIYKPKNFRHVYSEIFQVVAGVYEYADNKNLYFLIENLQKCKDYLETGKYSGEDIENLKSKFNKLYDHINLDIERINYIKNSSREYVEDYNKLVDSITLLYSRQEDLESRSKDSQKTYIAILGIFSSITLTFVAGISFSTSIIKSINDSSIFRLITVAVVVGLGITNLMYMLLAYMDRYTKSEDIEPFFNIKKFNWIGLIVVVVMVIIWLIFKYML